MSQHCKTIITAKPLHFGHAYTPAEVFTPLAKQPWAMWLDSSSRGHIDSQFDLIVWQPRATIIADDQQIVIEQNQQKTTLPVDEDPLIALSALQSTIFESIEIASSELPFTGGSVGYFSYDLGRSFEQLPKQAIKDIAMPEMAVGIYTHGIIFDNKTQLFFLICIEDERAQLEQTVKQYLQNTQNEPTRFKLTAPWQHNITKAQYTEKFNRVQHYLTEGDCYQINLTQRFSSRYQGNEFSAYLALRAANQAPFSAYLTFDNFSVLSVSPERFIQTKQSKVQTKPIKGTMARLADPIADQQQATLLSQSEKDKAENLMIVDLLRNDMSKVCEAGSVVVPKLFEIESFPAVHHLVSTVEGTLKENKTAIDLLRAAFPGGSITGAPKIRAMEIIDELEPQRRSIYCGSIGYISANGNMDTSITIRTLVCTNNHIYCWAGGGIVADSNVDDEYQESLDKVNKILPVLAAMP
ncbi:aminodeoxychorismate synthase component I [Thalassotalea hakodatensis]|uniref:aminodeoxychorismate synthase component I n=1 Tax=Thalassotalea hakodatensis TaxID=3030492 RepID=UPI0025742BE2|nr:aminodeoxychorismate synthase component I [Thalassotalea hakodatensis]